MGSINVPDEVDAGTRTIIAISIELFEFEVDEETNGSSIWTVDLSFLSGNINLIIFG